MAKSDAPPVSTTLLHGTRSAPLATFGLPRARGQRQLGQANYLTGDVAEHAGGVLYQNRNTGAPPTLTQAILRSTLSGLGASGLDAFTIMRSFAELAYVKLGKWRPNKLLAAHGVWTPQGCSDATGNSGPCDHRHQCVVLDGTKDNARRRQPGAESARSQGHTRHCTDSSPRNRFVNEAKAAKVIAQPEITKALVITSAAIVCCGGRWPGPRRPTPDKMRAKSMCAQNSPRTCANAHAVADIAMI